MWFYSFLLIQQNYYLYKGSCQGHLVQCRRNQDEEVEEVVAGAVLEEEEEVQTVLVVAGEDEEAVVVVLEATAAVAEAVSIAIEIPVGAAAAVLIEEEVDLGTVVVEAEVLKSGNCAKYLYVCMVLNMFLLMLSVMIELNMSIYSYNI